MNDLFVPVRILDRKWARKFVDGIIYMRSLSDFGSWKRLDIVKNSKVSDTLVNNFRGDLNEGAIKTISNPDDDEFFKTFPDDLKAHMKAGKIIDYGDIRYFNILCLFCLRYFPDAGKFEIPSERLKEFGDTAIVITDTNAFLNRLLEQVEWKTRYTCLINFIRYYSEDTTETLNPLFNKTCDYEWQKELRIALGRLNLSKKLKNGNYPILESDAPLKLRIGPLNDITMLVPIEDFINGNWDKDKVKFANSLTQVSPIDNMIQKTEKMMSEYNTKKFSSIFTI